MRAIILFLALFTTHAMANEVQVVNVTYAKTTSDEYTFHVTLRHNDTGWDHYADAWQILDENKHVLATRILYHPHENEQPFTRSLSAVKIPEGTKILYVRGHDKVHGDGELYKVDFK